MQKRINEAEGRSREIEAIANATAEAIEKIKNNHYDVVLMDLLMPVMDVYEATRQIRKMKKY